MSSPRDNIPIEVRRENWGWWGEPWLSYVCYDEDWRLIEEMHKPFPVGESCLLCDEEIVEGDSGTATLLVTLESQWIRHVHKECSFMNVVGSLAHQEGHCQAHGDGAGTGMTRRQEALEVWRRRQKG